MPIISIRGNENSRSKKNAKTTTTTKKQREKRTRDNRSFSEKVNAKWFCCSFKLGFIQLMCKDSLIFKSNLELALSIILKQRELYESQQVAVECRCLKIWDLLYFFICSSILLLKWKQVSPIYLELQLAQVNLCNRKDFKSLGIGSLYEK